MVLTRKWQAKMNGITVTMEAPFFNELLMSEDAGCLSRDLPCHALWHYYGLACIQFRRAERNLVDETERSEIFDETRARALFISIANQHMVEPEQMVKYWNFVDNQRRAMGGDEILPERFKFKFTGH